MMDARIQATIQVTARSLGITETIIIVEAIQEVARVLAEIAMAERVDYASIKNEYDRGYNLACYRIRQAILTAVGIDD